MATERRLSLFDLVAIGFNGIVGSGIFLVPMYVAAGARGFSPFAFLACGALCALVALCYAEVGGMLERSGGTYLYAREAFGDAVGFGVGWLVLVSAVLGYASVARGMGEEIARGAGLPLHWAAPAIGASIILALGAANWRGVKTGARTSDLLTIVKVSALVLFAVVGLLFIRRDSFAALGSPSLAGFAEGTFSALFALSGFEFVAVVAGDSKDARRNIPLSIVGSLLGAVLLYAVIQTVVVGVLGASAKGAAAPLVDAAAAFGGPGAGLAVRVAAIVSMIGFCSGSALVGPRLFASLAADGLLPAAVARPHPVRGTPYVAIAVVTLAAMAAVVVFGFKSLTDLTIVTLFAQYVPTVLAVLVFRRTRPEAPRTFRVPFGPVIPVVALAAMALLIAKLDKSALLTTAAILVVGVAVLAVTRASRRRRADAELPPAV